MYYVYLIQSVADLAQTYIGTTNDLKKRLAKHNEGGSPHTSKHKPWKLHAYFAFNDKDKAFDFERYLKSGSGRTFASKRFW